MLIDNLLSRIILQSFGFIIAAKFGVRSVASSFTTGVCKLEAVAKGDDDGKTHDQASATTWALQHFTDHTIAAKPAKEAAALLDASGVCQAACYTAEGACQVACALEIFGEPECGIACGVVLPVCLAAC